MNILKTVRNKISKVIAGDSRIYRAVDFQARLISELVVTPDLPKKWRERVKKILSSAGEITQICFVFTAFHTENGRASIEIIWPCDPLPGMMKTAEDVIRASLDSGTAPNTPADMDISHTSLSDGRPREFSRDNLELSLRCFSPDIFRPKCAVGAGVMSDLNKDRADRIVIDSVIAALVNIVSSITALSAYTHEIERFATRDSLTGLYNQVSFWDLLEYETERSMRQDYSFALLLIDLDNFKAINDSYGHDTGDMLLRDISSLIKSAVRKGDIPARYGGDKFTAILPVCDETQAYVVAERIIEAIRSFSITLPDGTILHLTASIGIAIFPHHAVAAKDLFLVAQTMLGQAKSSGKDNFISPSEDGSVLDLTNMGEKNIMILNAIDKHAIVPYFQPIISVKDSKIEAYEVLTRIATPGRVIPAAEFIETAENMGAIAKLDYQLMEKAFAQVKKNGYNGKLFINLSPKVFIISGFIPTVKRLLSEFGIEPTNMVFEITERDAVKNMKLVERHIKRLRDDGFRFAIDDFGAGYSSFQYIKTFSVDYIKVDGEFIRNMSGKGAMDRAIVTNIVSLAKDLGIKTIAEHVETEEIIAEVDAAGIDYAQGYYIQHPSPDLV